MSQKRRRAGLWPFVFTLIAITLVGACQNPGKQFMNNDPTNTAETPPLPPSSPDLKKFVFESDRFTNEVVPRELDPDKVANYLVENIDEKTSLKVLIQAEKAAAFYDTHELAEKYRVLFANAIEGDDALLRQIVILRTIARVGKPDDVSFAREMYERLIPRLGTATEFEEAIRLHDALNVGRSSNTLREALQRKLASLEAVKGSSDEARLEYLNFEENIAQKLDHVEQASAVKDSILGMADRKARIAEEIKAYLAIDYGYIEYLQPWAAARLRRETWAPQPDQQLTRPPVPDLSVEVANAFRAFLDTIGTVEEMDDEDKEAARVQVLRAVKFFGGPVDEQEEMFLAQFRGTQADLLANEGFLIP